MEATSKEEEEFKMTADEVDRLKKALKQQEFRDLLVDYANEISDPDNKKKYEEEIIALEKQRGEDVHFLKPQAGFVVKTLRIADKKKVFINICTSPQLQEHTAKKVSENGKLGTHFLLPHSIAPARDDLDRAGKPCIVYDVCFNPKTYQEAMQTSAFRELLITTAIDGIEKQSNEKFDRKSNKFPKLRYKGIPQASLIRKGAKELIYYKTTDLQDYKFGICLITSILFKILRPMQEIQNNNAAKFANSNTNCMDINGIVNFPCPDAKQKEKTIEDSSATASKENFSETEWKNKGKTTPTYNIVHRGYFDMQDFTKDRENFSNTNPKELLIRVELPSVKSASELELDIFEKKLVLESSKYFLELNLVYSIDEERGKAQFDKSSCVLTVILPLLKMEEEVHIKPSVEVIKNLEDPKFSSENCSVNIDSSAATARDDLGSKPTNSNGYDGHSEIKANGELFEVLPSVDSEDKEVPFCNGDSVHQQVEAYKKSELWENVQEQNNKTKNNDKNENSYENEISDESNVNEKNEETPTEAVETPENAELDMNIFKHSYSLFSELPPYTYDQTDSEITILVTVPGVEVYNLSISFTEVKVYVSLPQNPDDPSSAEWSLIVQLDEGNELEKDECCFDVTKDHLEISLVKRQQGLWTKIFVGVSEADLKVEFFLTDEMREIILKNFSKSEEGGYVEASKVNQHCDKNILSLEGRLNQLLLEQEMISFNEDVNLAELKNFVFLANEQENSTNTAEDGTDMGHEKNSKEKALEECSDNTDNDDLSLDVNLLDLQDDVIDENFDASKPAEKSRLRGTQRVIERSISYPYQDSRLKSILKRSKSDSGNYDTDDDYAFVRQQSLSVVSDGCYYASTDEDTGQRRRHKSVSFREKPMVFEFENLSRRQWKKQYKEGIRNNQSPTSLIPASCSSKSETQKMSKKKRKAEKKRQRNNSESKSEEEGDNLDLSTKKSRKKKKNKHKNKNINTNVNSSGRESSGTDSTEVRKKPSLNNPLIFQLD